MRHSALFRSLPVIGALLLLVAACAPAAQPSPTAAPAKPAATAAPAKPTEAPAKPAEAKPAASPAAAAKPAEAQPAASPAAKPAAQASAKEAPAQPAGQRVTLTGVTAWAKDNYFNDGYFEFERRLEKNSGGSITVTWRGGPEIAPTFEQAGVMKNGVFDLVNTTGSYYTTLVPEAPLFDLLDAPIQPIREGGIIDMFDQIHQQRAQIKLLGATATNVGFGLFMKKPINTLEDFRGTKIRSIPIYAPLIERLGASAVTTAPTDMYSALERGVVDGFGWPWATLEPLKLYEVNKYIVEPGWFVVHDVLIMNLNSWNRLTTQQQKILSDTIIEVERWTEDHFKQVYTSEMDRLINQHGMIVSRLPEAEARRYRQLAYDGAWESFVAAAPQNGPRIKERAAQFSRAWPLQSYHVFKPY